MKDKPTKPNGTLNYGSESYPVFWDLVDNSVYWMDIGLKSGLGMDRLKKDGWLFKPLPSKAVKEVKPEYNTPFKWPAYWGYMTYEDIDGLPSVPVEEVTEIGDNVKHPNHYNQDGQIECIDAIKAALGLEGFAAYCRGNTMKYNWRYKYKGGLEDLKKSQQYLTWLIETEEEIANADKV